MDDQLPEEAMNRDGAPGRDSDASDPSPSHGQANDDSLRERALRLLSEDPDAHPEISEEDLPRLLEELRLYQVELELQNEELRDARQGLERSLEQYADLYDFAPVGYITLDRTGFIRQLNLTAASILGRSREWAVGKTLTFQVVHQDLPLLRDHIRLVTEGKESGHCEIRLRGSTDEEPPRHVRIDSVPFEAEAEVLCRSAMVDITDRVDMERQLRQREEKYRRLFKDSLTGLILFEAIAALDGTIADLRCLETNSAFEEEAGLSRARVVDQRASQFLADGEFHWLMKTVDHVVRTGRPVRGTYKLSEKDRYFAYSIFSHSRGQVTVSFRDTTEETRSRQELERSEQLHRSIVERQGEGVVIVDEQERITFANPAAVAFHGSSVEELVGRRVEDFFEGEELRRLREQRAEREHGFTGSYTVRVPRKDGSTRRVRITATPRFEGEEFRGTLVLFHDISDLQEMEDALQVSEDRFTSLFHRAEDAMLLVEEESSRIIAANPAATALLGRSEEELTGTSPDQLFEPIKSGSPQPASEPDDAVPTRREQRLQLPGGERRDVEVIAQELPMGGRLVRHLLIYDISERRRAVEEMLAASRQEAVSTLAGGLAHEINNLMSSVVGYADLVQLELDSHSEPHEMLDHIRNSAVRASRITQLMLAYARGGHYFPLNLDINEVIQSTIRIQSDKTSGPVRFISDLEADLPPVHGDHSQLSLALMNILQNSAEASEEQGTIRVASRQIRVPEDHPPSDALPEGCYIQIEVSDRGHGMASAVRDRVFEPFFSTRFTGRGMGLPAVLGIMQSHKGHIEIESEAGSGTTVRLYLPCQPQDQQSQQPVTGERRPGEVHETLLLVEDDEQVIATMQRILSYLGYNLLTARNGVEALERIEEYGDQPIQLAILDMRMPEMDGPEVFPLLQEQRPEMKILLTSGYEFDKNARQLLAEGAVGFLQKPFNIKSLTSAIRSALSGVELPPPSGGANQSR